MFRTAPAAEPPADVVAADDPIPISHLGLDLPEPATGWASYLTGRGIPIVLDSIGRSAVSSADARQLLDERREAEARQAAKREAVEREAIERDQQFRAQIWGGLPAEYLPVGVLPAAVMLQADKDAQPRRRSVMQEALSNDSGLTFHSLAPTSDEGES
jgi:hypothetical protein